MKTEDRKQNAESRGQRAQKGKLQEAVPLLRIKARIQSAKRGAPFIVGSRSVKIGAPLIVEQRSAKRSIARSCCGEAVRQIGRIFPRGGVAARQIGHIFPRGEAAAR